LNANPLLQAWKTPHGLPPFDLFRPEHFEPALRHAMDVHRGEVAAISGQTAAPTFDNTVAAFDRSRPACWAAWPPCLRQPHGVGHQRRTARRAAPQWPRRWPIIRQR
jgi:Zn-dependent oligopeptidase